MYHCRTFQREIASSCYVHYTIYSCSLIVLLSALIRLLCPLMFIKCLLTESCTISTLGAIDSPCECTVTMETKHITRVDVNIKVSFKLQLDLLPEPCKEYTTDLAAMREHFTPW